MGDVPPALLASRPGGAGAVRPAAAVGRFAARLRHSLEADPGLLRGLGFVIGLLMVTLIRLFGPVVYAGYLDEAVGHEYFRGHRLRFGAILRTLPWGRLLVADLS